MNIPFELLYKIINACLKSDVEKSKDILVWNEEITTVELLLLNKLTYNYVIQNAHYHRLRLWKLLSRIPKQYQPVQLAVGISDTLWTIVDVEVRNERIGMNEYENFLVLEETMKFYTKPTKWKKSHLYLEANHHVAHRVPYFELKLFFKDLSLFTTNNLMSIWLWKRCNTFFKKDILFSMTNYHNNELFRPILDTQQKSLMAWDRPTSKKKRLTESVMLYNTELFGRLL